MHFYKNAFLIAILSHSFLFSSQVNGRIDTVTEIAPGYIFYGESYWCAESKSYVQGGVSFSWPSTFTTTPNVVVSVSSSTFSSAGQVVPLVVNNDQNGCTVYVNVATLSDVGEAQTGTFTVHVYAVANDNTN